MSRKRTARKLSIRVSAKSGGLSGRVCSVVGRILTATASRPVVGRQEITISVGSALAASLRPAPATIAFREGFAATSGQVRRQRIARVLLPLSASGRGTGQTRAIACKGRGQDRSTARQKACSVPSGEGHGSPIQALLLPIHSSAIGVVQSGGRRTGRLAGCAYVRA